MGGVMSTQPPIQWVPGALSPGIKRLGREADNPPSTIAEIKKMCTYTYTAEGSLLNNVLFIISSSGCIESNKRMKKWRRIACDLTM
jgi:hypothetical protein